MKKVLWISRHTLTREQHEGLEAVCGGAFELLWHRENVEALEELLPLAAQADVIGAVLPIHLLAGLVEAAGEKPVLIAMARRTVLPDGSATFAHAGWQRVEQLHLKLTPVQG